MIIRIIVFLISVLFAVPVVNVQPGVTTIEDVGWWAREEAYNA